MPQHLKVNLQVRSISGAEYNVKVITRVTDSCYKAKSIQLGLPSGMVGIPEYDYVTVDLTHAGDHCAEIVTDLIQDIDNIQVSEGKIGITVFVFVDGELAGSDHYRFPRRGGKEIILPLELDFADASDSTAENDAAIKEGLTCKDFDLLKIKGWPETKTVMKTKCVKILGHRVCTDVPVVYTRHCELHVTAKICHPDLAEIYGNVESCLKQAAVAGVIVGLITKSASAATETLTGYLKACLLSKGIKRASEISADVSPHSTSCSDWH